MMKKAAGLFRRLFTSRGFRRGTLILFWVTIAYIIYILVRLMIAVMASTLSFWEALRIFFSVSPFDFDPMWPFIVPVFLAIALGLICYFQRNAESSKAEEGTKEDKPAEASDAVQEEETTAPNHYQYH